MRSRTALLASALMVGALVIWALVRGGSSTTPAPPSRPPAAVPAPASTHPPAPSATRRNVFRFGDEPRDEGVRTQGAPSRRPAAAIEPTPLPEAGPRLVGLVRRGGRLVAAFVAPDGEVELAGPGETAVGVVVLAIGDESVRVRRSDGSEVTLPLP